MAINRQSFTPIVGSAFGGTTTSFSVVINALTSYLIVFSYDEQGDSTTGATCNNIAMTLLKKETRSPNEGSLEIYAWGLANPTSGNVVVTRTGTTARVGACSVSVGNTNPAQPDAAASSNGNGVSSTSITTSITTVSSNTGVWAFSMLDNGGNFTGTNQVALNSLSAYTLFESIAFPVTPAGTYSYTATSDSSASNVAQIVIALDGPSAAVNAYRDENNVPTKIGVLNTDGVTVTRLYANPGTNGMGISDGTSGADHGTKNAKRDENEVPCMMAVSSADGVTPVALYVNSSGNLIIKSS